MAEFCFTDGPFLDQSQYIRDLGLAGGMIWALDLDDFRNRCGQGAHPLMNTIKSVLGESSMTQQRYSSNEYKTSSIEIIIINFKNLNNHESFSAANTKSLPGLP